MNLKTILISLLLIVVFLAGIPESFARPQYLTNLTAVYPSASAGKCGTCHVMPSGNGLHNSNGTSGQHNPGTYVPSNNNKKQGQHGSNGWNNSNKTLPLNSYGTLFENQADHATDPNAALMAIGQPPLATATPGESTSPATGTKAAPGFDLVVFVFGTSAGILLARRHKK